MYNDFSPKNNAPDNILSGKQASPRQDKRKHRFHLGNGAALILVALMIISLLCFAALSIVSAKADSRLTDRYAAQITAYHTARNLGVEFLAETDAQLKQYLEDSADREAYLEKARSLPSCTDPSEENPVLQAHDVSGLLLVVASVHALVDTFHEVVDISGVYHLTLLDGLTHILRLQQADGIAHGVDVGLEVSPWS